MNERGSVSILVAVIVPGLVIASMVIAALGQVAVASERAVTAAEAGALAAAPVTFRPFGAQGSATEEASRVATSNGAVLVSCACVHDATWATRIVRVEVEVSTSILIVGEVTLTRHARAEFAPVALLPR